MKSSSTHYFALSFVCSSLLLWSCANQGSPEGGPYDTEPPRLLQANPNNKATSITSQRLVLTFNENIKLSSQQDKIIVSPPQRETARITASGRNVVIQLEDTLKPETTYSFYFDDAIVDNNEDNPLEDFSYLVSTGSTIDSMQISGRVVDALTFEPIGGLIVGAYRSSSFADSLLKSTPFPYISKTNKQGNFTIRGLAIREYQVFATKDNDVNYRYNEKSEGLAFDRTSYLTRLLDSVRTDTIRIDSIVRRDTLHRDSLVTYPYTYYYPNNLTLRYSVPQIKQEGLERHSRLDSLVCRLEFLSEPKHLPKLRLLDKPEIPAERLYWATAKGRTIDYWLLDKELIHQDSIKFVLAYAKTDSLGQIREKIDTLTFLRPPTRATKKETSKKEVSPLQVSFAGTSGIYTGTPHDTLYLQSNRPLAPFDSSVIKLEAQEDSTSHPLPFHILQDSLDRLRYILDFPREYGKNYKVSIDSARLQDVYGATSDSIAFIQRVQPEKEFGGLSVTLIGIRENALVQLLNKSDAVLAQQRAKLLRPDTIVGKESQETPDDPQLAQLLKQQAQATKQQVDTLGLKKKDTDRIQERMEVIFRDLKPGDYFLRLIVDKDGNNTFTPGDYPELPEEVYYCPQTFSIKQGFTSQERWDIHAISPFLAKPDVLRQVKPDEAKKKREDKNVEYYKRWGRRQR